MGDFLGSRTEALGMLDKPTLRQSRELGVILDNLDGWERGEERKRFPLYKQQRYWKRIVTARLERINDEILEIVDA